MLDGVCVGQSFKCIFSMEHLTYFLMFDGVCVGRQSFKCIFLWSVLHFFISRFLFAMALVFFAPFLHFVMLSVIQKINNVRSLFSLINK